MRIEVKVSRLVSQCCVYLAALLINVKAAEPEQSPQVWMSALHLPATWLNALRNCKSGS